MEEGRTGADERRLAELRAQLLAARPSATQTFGGLAKPLLIVVGVSEFEGPAVPRLHVAMAHGPGFEPGTLTSPSTRGPTQSGSRR